MNKIKLLGNLAGPSAFLLCMIVLYSFACKAENALISDEVCFKEDCVRVEVVRSPDDVQRGLQEREFLAKDAGMLFVFPESRRYSFWMKKTLIPLDMLWIDENYKVVFIASDVQPCKSDPCPTYTPPEEARFVLEVNAGYAKENSIRPGDVLRFKVKDDVLTP